MLQGLQGQARGRPPNGARYAPSCSPAAATTSAAITASGLAQAQWRRGASARLLHHPRLRSRAGILQRIYEEAIALVGKVTPGVRLFVHDYDFAIPDGRCVTGPSPHLRADFRFLAGPWMRPAFEERAFISPAIRCRS